MRFTFLAAMLALAACSAGTTGGEDKPDDAAFSPDRIKADVTFLADDLLQGRDTGSPGHEIAARYVAARFAALGLTPGNNGSWFQPIEFAKAVKRPDAQSGITIDGRFFANGSEVVMAPSTVHPDQSVDAEVVFAGYGFDDPALGADDYAGLDVKGKVVVVLWGFPKGAPSEIAAHLVRMKAQTAYEHGAIGLLQLQTPARDAVQKWEDTKARATATDMKWIGADGAPTFVGSKLQVEGYVGPGADQALMAGSPVPLAELYAATLKEGARPKGFALDRRLRIERHSDVTRLKSPNVMGILPGSDPKLKDEYIVLTAHLDHLGIVAPVNGDAIANGAMDNAMGVSTLLEAARGFVESGKRPRRSIMFVAVTGEEKGLLGADYLAQHPVLKGGRIVGLVNLDMPVATYDFVDLVAFGAEHSTIAKSMARAIAGEGLKVVSDPEPEQTYFVRTDHYPFVKAGVPAVSLDLGPGGAGAKATKEFVDNRYHKPSDDLTGPINWKSAARIARINFLVARELANQDERPMWYEGDYFGDRFAKGEPKARR